MDQQELEKLLEDRLYCLAYTKHQIFTSAFMDAAMNLGLDIEYFRLYWNQTELYLDRSIEERKEKLDKLEKQNPESVAFLYLDKALASMMITEAEKYSYLIRSSFFITLVSYFEAEFSRYARMISGDETTTFDGMERTKDYLVKVQKISYPFGTSRTWHELQNIRAVRNCIVHNQSDVSGLTQPRKTKLISYVRSCPSLSLYKNELQIQKEYIDIVLNTIDMFCWSFLESISDRFVAKSL